MLRREIGPKLAIAQLTCISQIQASVRGNRRLPNVSLLKVGRIREATDPRDKIWVDLKVDEVRRKSSPRDLSLLYDG